MLSIIFENKCVKIESFSHNLIKVKDLIWGIKKAFKIEEKAQEIGKRVEELRKHLLSYEDYMRKIGKSLSTTVGQYNDAYKELKKVDKDIVKITGSTEAGIEPEMLDKPAIDD
jgi:DNA recombination protein RmuC